jgi:hypothetical protein
VSATQQSCAGRVDDSVRQHLSDVTGDDEDVAGEVQDGHGALGVEGSKARQTIRSAQARRAASLHYDARDMVHKAQSAFWFAVGAPFRPGRSGVIPSLGETLFGASSVKSVRPTQVGLREGDE